MSESKADSGFTCECGTFHKYGVYVHAHWHIRLRHTCDECGAIHGILAGEVEMIKAGESQKEPTQ